MIKIIPWPPFVIAGLRSGIAFFVILLYDRPKSINFGKYTILGGIFYTVMVICFIIANKLTSAGNVILIQYAAPLYVAIFSFIFLGEKLNRYDWLTIIILLIGLLLFFFEKLSFNQILGNIFAIFSGFGFAGTILLLRKQKNSRPLDSILIGNFLTLFICFPFFYDGLTSDTMAWIGIFYLGIIQLGLTYCLYSNAIKYVSALDASIYTIIEPISSPILAYIVLEETMTKNSLIGGIIILVVVLLRAIVKDKIFKK